MGCWEILLEKVNPMSMNVEGQRGRPDLLSKCRLLLFPAQTGLVPRQVTWPLRDNDWC